MYIEGNKVGGGSVKDASSIKMLAHIVKHTMRRPGFCVVSAIGKTTDMIEPLAHALFEGSDAEANAILKEVEDFHFNIMKELFPEENIKIYERVGRIFSNFRENMNYTKVIKNPDFIYDQVVPLGETLSATIINYYLNVNEVPSALVDASSIIMTDTNFRNAEINMEETEKAARNFFNEKFWQRYQFFITEGFIGRTFINGIKFQMPFLTTLNREGSDISGATFANLLGVYHMNFWKDVPGVMTADPNKDKDAKLISKLSYTEFRKLQEEKVIGQLLHEKSLGPLKAKGIPFSIRPFNDPSSSGTLVS